MKTIGFPKPRMSEENRIAISPDDVYSWIVLPGQLYFERGYGKEHGFKDDDYRDAGAKICLESTVCRHDIICQPKFCDGDFERLERNRTLFGWVHLEGEYVKIHKLKRKRATVIEWDSMKKRGKKVFYENGLLTGRIAILQSIAYAGKPPEKCNVAVIGRGRVGKGAVEELKRQKAANIKVYHKKNLWWLRRHIDEYDMIVHCACSDTTLLSEKHLSNMKKGALLVHVGSDSMGADYGANSVYDPLDWINNHRNPVYCVDHVPTLWYKLASQTISRDAAPYIDMLVREEPNKTLENAVVMKNGVADARLLG